MLPTPHNAKSENENKLSPAQLEAAAYYFAVLFRPSGSLAILLALAPDAQNECPVVQRCDLNDAIPEIEPRVLSDTLDGLEAAQFVARVRPDEGNGVFYSLPAAGVAILPLVRQVIAACRPYEATLLDAVTRRCPNAARRKSSV